MKINNILKMIKNTKQPKDEKEKYGKANMSLKERVKYINELNSKMRTYGNRVITSMASEDLESFEKICKILNEHLKNDFDFDRINPYSLIILKKETKK